MINQDKIEELIEMLPEIYDLLEHALDTTDSAKAAVMRSKIKRWEEE